MKGMEMKPECERVRNLLNIDRSKDEQDLVLAHIENCPLCKREYEEAEAVFSLFDVALEEPPAELHSRIMDAVRKEVGKKKARILPFGTSFAKRFASVACAAVICLTVVGSPLLARVVRTQGSESDITDFVVPGDSDTIPESNTTRAESDVPKTPEEPRTTELTSTAAYKAEVIEALHTQTRANQMLHIQLSSIIEMVDLMNGFSRVEETPLPDDSECLPSPEESEN